MSSYTVDQMKPADFDNVMDLITTENWRLSKLTFQLMMVVDKNSFFVARDQQTGTILGMCCGFIISPSLAFISFYLVRSNHRSRGIGTAIWHRVMQHVDDGHRNIGLLATDEMMPVYRDKLGFNLTPVKQLKLFGKADCSQLNKTVDGLTIEDVTKENFNLMLEYDKDVCEGFDRRNFLEALLQLGDVFLLAQDSHGQVKGCCAMVTDSNEGAELRQLYADSRDIAECLLAEACCRLSEAETKGLWMRGWNANDNTPALAKKIGLQVLNEFPALYTKQPVFGRVDNIYNVSVPPVYPF